MLSLFSDLFSLINEIENFWLLRKAFQSVENINNKRAQFFACKVLRNVSQRHVRPSKKAILAESSLACRVVLTHASPVLRGLRESSRELPDTLYKEAKRNRESERDGERGFAGILPCPSEMSYSCRVPQRQYFTPVGFLHFFVPQPVWSLSLSLSLAGLTSRRRFPRVPFSGTFEGVFTESLDL